MRIEQGFVGATFFKKAFLSKYGLKQIFDYNRPAVFYGMYPKQINLALAMKKPCVIVWCGSDALFAKDPKHNYRRIFKSGKFTHIAKSNMIKESLKEAGLMADIKLLPVTPFEYKGYKPETLGDSVYFYGIEKTGDLYGVELFKEVRERLEHANIPSIWLKPLQVGTALPSYRKSFCGLRLTKHDGMANTVVEMVLMGRRCLWNDQAPGCEPFRDTKDIMEFVRREQMRRMPDLEAAQAMKKFISVNDNWLNI